MEYFITYWLVAVIVGLTTCFAPLLVSEPKPSWASSFKWGVVATLLIGTFTHATWFLG